MEVAARTLQEPNIERFADKNLYTWYGILVIFLLGNVVIFLAQAQYCPTRVILAG